VPFPSVSSRVARPAPIQRFSAQRWYSSEKISNDANNESNKEQAELLGAEDKAKLDASVADPAQKELEAKKKEVVDLTVC
jgi:hypothetical protein